MMKQIIKLSDNAAQRIKEIMSKAESNAVGVRVGVKSGGCAGMSYIMEYTKEINPNDEIIEDFLEMIKEKSELNSKNLKDDEKTKLMSLSGVKQYPMRVKCATLSWHTLTSAIDKPQNEINVESLEV